MTANAIIRFKVEGNAEEETPTIVYVFEINSTAVSPNATLGKVTMFPEGQDPTALELKAGSTPIVE